MSEEITADSTSDTSVVVKKGNTKFCSNCGAEIDAKAVVCPKCGVQVAQININKEPKSRTMAIILALFVGSLGIHKLYLKEGKWWLYLLFCWTFIPVLVSLYDLITYAMMSDEAFHEKYG